MLILLVDDSIIGEHLNCDKVDKKLLYNYPIMTTELLVNWTAILVGITTLFGTVAASIRWLVKHYLNELKPNGGGSLKDTVSRLERDQQVLFQKLDDMYHVILEHVAKHN